MKTELIDVNETRKSLRVEIPHDVVNAEIDRVARDYSRRTRIPGFRPGKAPAHVIKQRYKDQILREVAQDLVPRAVNDALRERGVEAVDTPDVRDVVVDEGRPLTFTASFDTLPAFEPGDYASLALRQPSVSVPEEAVDQALGRLRERAARYEPIEGRGVDAGDTVTLDLERRRIPPPSEATKQAPRRHSSGSRTGEAARGVDADRHENVNVELGSKTNPPGFDEQLLGLEVGARKELTIHYPADHPVQELANTDVSYAVEIKAIKQRVLPELDDEFAKDLGEFETLDALRARVREDLEHEARRAADRGVRAELMKQLAARVPFEVPTALVERELDRRLDEFARSLMEQKVDPRRAGIDWMAFRETQRDLAREAVAGSIALNEVARREQLHVTDAEIEQEIARYAEQTDRAPVVVRARLEKEGGLARVAEGLRREKAIDFLMARATISQDT